jgi:hypothetical protein
MIYTFKPIVQWQGKPTSERRNSLFRASYNDTIKLLDRELAHLNAREPIVIQTYMSTRDIRIDGLPRADVRQPDNPGVIVTCEIFFWNGTRNAQGQRLGTYRPISFPCDKFFDWKDNLRAIALSLEALRKVDRFGVTKTGEQYKGWTALPPMPSNNELTEDDAVSFISAHSGELVGYVMSNRNNLESAYRKAARNLHPDAGGSTEDFIRLNQSYELLMKRYK